MPLYEYRCESCNKTHEIIQKFSDAPLQDCPECQGPVEKLMSLASFALKGSGWYTTDYARKGKKSESSEKKTETCGAAACETKPACAN
jgi:putative FmdB family regulatory protein